LLRKYLRRWARLFRALEIPSRKKNPASAPAPLTIALYRLSHRREHTGEAIETLALILKNPKAPAAARIAAATALLDRGWGKPPQQIEAVAAQLIHEDWVDIWRRKYLEDAAAGRYVPPLINIKPKNGHAG
jgi:hypothetical protein